MKPVDDIHGAKAAHARLLATVDGLDDDVVARPSLLPGWSIAMVVTHLAVNAESHRRIFEGAVIGEARTPYADGVDRDELIAAGRSRPAAMVVAHLQAAVVALEAVWDELPEVLWGFAGIEPDGSPYPVAHLPFHRWRETEVHHADLGLGYTTADWDPAYVELEIAATLAEQGDELPPLPTDRPRHEVLAWLLGRSSEGFPPIGPWRWSPRP
jgi:maleylpyruvate isomerase